MPSHLRLSSTFEPVSANATYQPGPASPPSKKQKMSLTQTYYVASTARSKLGAEAGRADHNLRLLVGHANLLDSLMVELADAEREQEAWFNSSVTKASKPEERHIQEEEEEDSDSDSDSDSESDAGSDVYDEDVELFSIPVRAIRMPAVEVSSAELEHEDYDDEEDDVEHALIRVASQHSPPELTSDSDSESEEDEGMSMPSSPKAETWELSEKERRSITTTAFYNDDAPVPAELQNYLLQQQAAQQQPMIAAC